MNDDDALETVLDSLRLLWRERASARPEQQADLARQIGVQYERLGEIINNA